VDQWFVEAASRLHRTDSAWHALRRSSARSRLLRLGELTAWQSSEQRGEQQYGRMQGATWAAGASRGAKTAAGEAASAGRRSTARCLEDKGV
jgi:hypothetical protein